MNRRAAIRKVLGAGAVVAALPVLDKVVQANSYDGPCGSAPGCATPPPPDTRTPEQVLADQEQESIRDITRHLTQEQGPWSRRYVYGVWAYEFNRVWTVAQEQGLAIERRTVNGVECLIGSNGNLVRRLEQPIYFA